MPVPTHTIAEVKRLTVLPVLVGEYVRLRKMGNRYTGLCPFHSEKTGSLSVHLDYFKCFGCDAKGDAFNFLMMIEGVSFNDALKKLASYVGISLDGAPIPRAVVAAEREDRLMSEWWWGNHRDSASSALGDAVASVDDDLAETIGHVLRWTDAMKPADRLIYFKSHVTSDDRRAYHEWVTSENDFAKAWMSLAGVSG